MGKIDVKSAYRIIPIHPSDRYLLGMKWRDHYFIDLALPFGLRSAPSIFNTLADLFEWLLKNNYSVQNLLHYLDDFFTIGKAGSSNGTDFLRAIKQAATDTGIPLAPEKCEGPVTCMNFLVILGIELDSVQMTARLPPDKLRDLVLLIKQWVHKKWCKPKELQSLVESWANLKGNCHELRMHLSKFVCGNKPGFLATFRSRNLLFCLE